MSFKVDADLIALFKGLISSLEPYAKSQDVKLSFNSYVITQNSYYHPKEIIPDITNLLTQIISFTPQSYEVLVTIDYGKRNEKYLYLNIMNTGVNLIKITEIPKSINFKIIVENPKKNSTLFKVKIPVSSAYSNRDVIDSKPLLYPNQKKINPYYAEISKRLKSHFGSIDEIEIFAAQKDYSHGVFLKKINTIISSHITDNNFNVDILADSVALSRTQLFRKIKQLTKMSPGRYILFFRLQRAKQLLQSKDKEFNVSEVCFKVGFLSKSHFTRSFQKQFGFNPSQCH